MVTPNATLVDREIDERQERVHQEAEVGAATKSPGAVSVSSEETELSTDCSQPSDRQEESFYETKQRRASRRRRWSRKERGRSLTSTPSRIDLQSSASSRSSFSESFYQETSPSGSTRILRALQPATSSLQTNLAIGPPETFEDEEMGLTSEPSEEEASPANVTSPGSREDVDPASPSSSRLLISSSSVDKNLAKLESKALSMSDPVVGFVPGRVEASSFHSEDGGADAHRDVNDENTSPPPEATEIELVHATSVVRVDLDADDQEDDNSRQRQRTHDLPIMYARATPLDQHDEEKRRRNRQRMMYANVAAIFAVAVVVAGFTILSKRTHEQTSTPTPTAAPTFSDEAELIEFLSAQSQDGGAALSNSSTPQGQALAWLLDTELNPRLSADHWTVDRYVMATLYYALDGPSWNKQNYWLESEDVCDWYSSGGRPCNDAGMLTEIDLTRNKLKGAIPGNELAMLAPRLKVLDLFDNELTGTIPSELGLLTQLQTLSLESNQLNNRVPWQLGQLESLSKLILDDNDFVGDIPPAVCSLDIDILWADCKEIYCPCCTKCCVDEVPCGNA